MPQPEQAPGAWRPAAIVWDLDGTLVDSASDLAKALNALLNESGLPGHAVDEVRLMIGAGVGKLIERGFRAAGVKLEVQAYDERIPRFMEIYAACATESTYLLPGALEALRKMQQLGVRQGLCTNKPVGVTRLILENLGVSHFFGSVVGGDSTPRKKPHALPLQTCLHELGVRPEEALMVGDSGADVGSARAAGIQVVLVSGGYTGVAAESLGADLVIDRLDDVTAWEVWRQ